MQRNILLLVCVILALWATFARSATVRFSTVVPSDANELPNVTNLAGAVQDRDNIGGDGAADGPGNDGTTYVAYDRAAQGQTFTTGSSLAMFKGVWIRHVGYSGNNPGGTEPNNTYYTMPASSQLIVRLTNPAAAGTEGFVLAAETCTITGTEPDVLPAASTNTADGTGTWIYAAFDAPVALSVNTSYGFDVAGSGGLFFEALGIRDGAAGGNPYAAGTAYTSGSGGAGNNTMTVQAGDRVFIADLEPLRTGASNPGPANGVTSIDSDAVVALSWDAGQVPDPGNPSTAIANPDILYHYVYLSNPNDPNLVDITPVSIGADTNPADGNVDPSVSYLLAGLLESDSTYYWRVDEIMDNGTGNPYPVGDPNNIIGTVWSFQTELKQAQLDPAYPHDASVAAGEQATFTVVAVNPLTGDETGMTYQWYDDNGILTGENGTEYVKTASAGDDRSTYYCQVTVTAAGKTISSRTATLFIKKQIAHWLLDGNAEDASADGLYDGTLAGTASFETGKISQALSFNGTDTHIDLPDGMDSFGGGLTFNLWAMPTAAGSWARFLDFGNGAPEDNIYFCRQGTADTLYFSIYNGTAGMGVSAANTLSADEWQMLSVTMDQSGNVVLYKNGSQVQTGTVALPATVVRTINYVGRSNWTADAYYQGLMDDIQVFNYAKTADEIAQFYFEVEGAFCQQSPLYDFTGPAGVPDCMIDIYELRAMASEWLNCGVYPDCY